MEDIEMQSHVVFKCVRERGKLRVKILTAGYMNQANCQFPRDIRKEGCHYKAKAGNIRLVTTRGKYYYSVSRGYVEVLGETVEKPDLVGVRSAPGAAPSSAAPATTGDPTANIKVFEDDRTDDCCICMCVEKQIVFNCGHLYTCQACSVMVHTCPICRQRITQRINKKLFG
jgi:hypothetical protein